MLLFSGEDSLAESHRAFEINWIITLCGAERVHDVEDDDDDDDDKEKGRLKDCLFLYAGVSEREKKMGWK